jgi:hypothetical protein
MIIETPKEDCKQFFGACRKPKTTTDFPARPPAATKKEE